VVAARIAASARGRVRPVNRSGGVKASSWL
jgi:hypothetical protein